MPNEGRGRLDNAIDRAVRGMMQVDPAPGLRHRVADRIDAPARRAWALPAFAAVSVMVVVIAAFALLRTAGTAPDPDSRVVAAPAAVPASPPAPVETAPPIARPSEPAAQTASEPILPRTSESIFGRPTGRVSAANLAPDMGTSDDLLEAPLDPPAPSGVVAPPVPITIAPITLTPIRIPPVMVDPIRDHR